MYSILSWKFYIYKKVAFGTKKNMYIRKEFIVHENTNMAACYLIFVAEIWLTKRDVT